MPRNGVACSKFWILIRTIRTRGAGWNFWGRAQPLPLFPPAPIVDEPLPPEEELPDTAPPPASLAERLASLPPGEADVDVTVLGRAKEDPPVEVALQAAALAADVEPLTESVSGEADDHQPELEMEEAEIDESAPTIASEPMDEMDDTTDPEPDDESAADYEDDEADGEAEEDPAQPAFWQTGRGAAVLVGLVVLLLLCAGCIVLGLVVYPLRQYYQQRSRQR
jgi:hypothetical protein